jgi:proline dehydrogenase
MGISRSILLAASQSKWLREHAGRYRFVRRTVSRFLPGEELDDALAAARGFESHGMATVFTHLGENVTNPDEVEKVAQHYLGVLDRIRAMRLPAEISVKLTHLGLDLDSDICDANLRRLIERAGSRSTVWIDMEGSPYVDATLKLYRRARSTYPNVGVCLQAYLYRTADDLAALMPLGPAIRLVKGAYNEPASIAFPRKRDVDENFFELTQRLLGDEARRAGLRAAIATHDLTLIRRTQQLATSMGLAKDSFEFEMLYGIQRAEQFRLAKEGWRSTVLIAYGSYWFPWFMRRLAERPANVGFFLRNLFSR